MYKAIDKLEEYPLDNFDIDKILTKDPAKQTKYSELKNITDINQLFNSNNQAILFYDLGEIGHWTGLIRHVEDNTIEYFDPYGLNPSAPLKWIDKAQRDKMGINSDYLNPLLKKAKMNGTNIIINKYKFQSMMNKDNNTCGRHVVTRMLFSHLTLPEYHQVLKNSGLNPDQFVTVFSFKILGK